MRAPIVNRLAKPAPSPLLRPKMNAAIAAVSRSEPRTSIDDDVPAGGSAGSARAKKSIARMMGGLIKKIERQPKNWVSAPPTTMPVIAPAAVIACHTPSAFVRSGPCSVEVVSSESAAGDVAAAASPCTMRAATSSTPDCAKPQASDAIAKTIRPPVKTRRRPSTSAARPPASSSAPNVNAYPVTIHWSCAGGRRRSRRTDGSATLTMLKSSCSTNWAKHVSATTARTDFAVTRS